MSIGGSLSKVSPSTPPSHLSLHIVQYNILYHEYVGDCTVTCSQLEWERCRGVMLLRQPCLKSNACHLPGWRWRPAGDYVHHPVLETHDYRNFNL